MESNIDKIVDKWHEDLKRDYNKSIVPVMTTDIIILKRKLKLEWEIQSETEGGNGN